MPQEEPPISVRDDELARRAGGKLHLRPDALRVRWELRDLLSSDGHEIRGHFSCSLAALTDPVETRVLEEVLMGGHTALTRPMVAGHLAPMVNSAAARAAGEARVEDLLSDDGKVRFSETIRSALQSAAFSCGIEILPPINLDLQSPTLHKQRLETAHRGLAEQQMAGRVEHLQRSANLMEQFVSLRQASPGTSAGNLLGEINPTDRGATLQGLFLAESRQSNAPVFWAAAGPYLVRIDAAQTPTAVELIPLPATLGPLRSVRTANIEGCVCLLVGARQGFFSVPLDSPNDVTGYTDSELNSDLGFNRVIYLIGTDQFCASHGEGGLVFWKRGQQDSPAKTLRPASLGGPPRNLIAVDDLTAAFTVEHQIFTSSESNPAVRPVDSEYPDKGSPIVALLTDSRHLFAVHEDGLLCILDHSGERIAQSRKLGHRIRAAGLLPWLGEARLLLAIEDGPVQCVGIDDDLTTQFHSPHRGHRLVAGSTHHVAALSSDRQRLILWNTWDGRSPAFEIYLAGLARHRVADICVGINSRS